MSNTSTEASASNWKTPISIWQSTLVSSVIVASKTLEKVWEDKAAGSGYSWVTSVVMVSVDLLKVTIGFSLVC